MFFRLIIVIILSFSVMSCKQSSQDSSEETASVVENSVPPTPSALPDLGSQAQAVSPPLEVPYTYANFKQDIDNIRDRPVMSTDQEVHIRQVNSKLISIKNIRDRYKYGKDVDAFEAVLNCALNFEREDEISLRVACLSLLGGFSDTFMKINDIEALLKKTLANDSPYVRAVTYWFLKQKDQLLVLPEIKGLLKRKLDEIRGNTPEVSPYDDAVISLLFRQDDRETLRDAVKSSCVDMLRAYVSLNRAGDEQWLMNEIGIILNKERPLYDREYDFLCKLSNIRTGLRLDQYLKDDIIKLSENIPESDRQWFEGFCNKSNPYMVIRGFYDLQ